MKKLIRIFAILLFILIFVGTLVFLYFKSKPKAQPVKTVAPIVTDIVKKTVATGRIVARKEVEIKPHLSGVIDEILVDSNQQVQKNQILAKIRVIPSLVQVNNAEARLKKARIAHEDAQKTHRRVRQRYQKTMRAGKLTLSNRSPNLIKLRQAEADRKQAALDLQDAQDQYEREKKLIAKKIISKSSFEDTALMLSKTKEAHDKARTHYEMVRAETLDATKAEYQKAQMELLQAREDLKAAENHLQLIREGVTKASGDQSNTLIRATIEGMVLEVPVKEGSLVVETSTQSSGTTIAILADMTDMIFEGNLDETEIGKIHPGMPLMLTIGAIEGQTFAATIEHIAPKGKEVSGTVQFGLRAKVELNLDFFIRSGYSASADIILEKREKVLAIDEGNLFFKGDKVFVDARSGPGQFKRRRIETGLSDGINIEVVSGLSADDRIKVRN